jgi:hypothetical protein
MKEFIIRGQTGHGLTHIINFGGHKGDYGFKLIEFKIYPSTNIGAQHYEMTASITAGKTALDPDNPNFNEEGLIASAVIGDNAGEAYPHSESYVINNTFIITQDLLLLVKNINGDPVNWQCKFFPVKLSSTEAALTNYRQFSIFDE